MIELATFGKHVYAISANDIKLAENISETQWGIFQADSKCALVEITPTDIRIKIGRHVTVEVYKHILGLALKHGKRLVLIECEDLKNLRAIDTLIETYNNQFCLFI